jgi:serine/threonine protein kinase
MVSTLHMETVELVLDEAGICAKVYIHDYITTVVEHGSESLPWIAMEYMDSGYLDNRFGKMDFLQTLWTAITVTKGVRKPSVSGNRASRRED